VAVYR
jgi:hypothetical protein